MPPRSTYAKSSESGSPQAGTADVPFPFDALTAPIAERIRREGVDTCRAWVALGLRRFRIFGVVSSTVVQIDGLVREKLIEAQATRVQTLKAK